MYIGEDHKQSSKMVWKFLAPGVPSLLNLAPLSSVNEVVGSHLCNFVTLCRKKMKDKNGE